MSTTTAMSQRALGRSELKVSAMGLGCWAIGGPWRWLDGPGGWGDIDDNEFGAARFTPRSTWGSTFSTPPQHMVPVTASRFWGVPWKANVTNLWIATKFGFNVNEEKSM